MQKLVVIAARESKAVPPPPTPRAAGRKQQGNGAQEALFWGHELLSTFQRSPPLTISAWELKISPPPSKVPTSPVSKKNPFVSRNRYKAGCPGLAALRASSQAGLAVPLPAFPLYCNIAKGGGGEKRAKPLGFQGRGALAGGAGGSGGGCSRRSRKGEEGAKGCFFFFFLKRCSEAGLGGPRVKWQAAESRSVSLSPRRSPPPPAPREQLQEPSARAARLQARRSGSNCCNRCCKFGNVASLCIFPRPAAPAPARAPPAPPPPPPSSLPRARWLARGWRRWPLGRASCLSSRGAAAETTAPERRRRRVRRPGGGRTREPGSCGRPGPGALEPAPLPGLLPGPLPLPGSEEEEEEAAAAAAALASSRLARSLRGAYTCVTDRAKSQLLPGSAADVSDPQPLGGRIVQAE
ncbi:WAS/WASL-interacting protein family member 1-like [Zalophus californianus]|uniref:WAS/WASL-interacting protein family member 1-like n=1 Tax=Zalophus californianus TaxID=9704 RepID=A0A6P9FC51_ZALCA|nr:WAS/WASL-interacting protein family member 1-like [Zalophus californianus]